MQVCEKITVECVENVVAVPVCGDEDEFTVVGEFHARPALCRSLAVGCGEGLFGVEEVERSEGRLVVVLVVVEVDCLSL